MSIKKKLAQFIPTFFDNVNFKGDVLVKIFHFTIFLFWPYVKNGEYRIEFFCKNVIF